MKNIIIGGIMVLGLFAPQITQAQGTITYLSNLGQPSTNSAAVGSDSWLAMSFATGTNAGGYALDSVQLAMADGSGTPSDFTVMLYSAIYTGVFLPASSLGALNGSTDPVAGGIFTYIDNSSLVLSPNTPYFIVVTAGTPVANGAYEWSRASSAYYNPSGGWQAPFEPIGAVECKSANGSSWYGVGIYGQFAIDATAVPEPGVLSLLAMGGLGFLWHRRKAGAV
jgi:hypothetical protein